MLHDSLASNPVSTPTAIFSPSVARIAASTARDWAYIDLWLTSKLTSCGNSMPSFERNKDTLQILQALAAANETVDEDNTLLARTDATVLDGLADAGSYAASFTKDAIVEAIHGQLSHQAHLAVDCVASLALQAATPFAEPQKLGRAMMSLESTLVDMQHMSSRADLLHLHVQRSADQAKQLLDSLDSLARKSPSYAAKQNLDMQRQTKLMAAQLASHSTPDTWLEWRHATSIDDVGCHQRVCIDLMTRGNELSAQLTALEGFVGCVDDARNSVQVLQRQLHDTLLRRNLV
ncbi:hypothetical protein CDD82_1177 [Ophiocordyceps australis]|uniref:Uncharacterized protein n=1 Tax=Ophiocordyceps australis TaxID=1399860 RepID=A0A2C5YLB5_9HYPO|nr:hypothetical protein CDD82_1177 [Ophiocordyceps australis]